MENTLNTSDKKENLFNNLFYFKDGFCVNSTGIMIFVGSDKKNFLPIIIKSTLPLIIVKNIKLYKTDPTKTCGIYSYVLNLLNKYKKNITLDCVCFTWHQPTNLIFANLVIRNNKTKKIDDISNTFIMYDDAALLAALADVPIYINNDHIKLLTYEIPHGTSDTELIDLVKIFITGA